MERDSAALMVIVELRQRIEGLEQVNAAVTAELGELRGQNSRLHSEIDRLHDEAEQKGQSRG